MCPVVLAIVAENGGRIDVSGANQATNALDERQEKEAGDGTWSRYMLGRVSDCDGVYWMEG